MSTSTYYPPLRWAALATAVTLAFGAAGAGVAKTPAQHGQSPASSNASAEPAKGTGRTTTSGSADVKPAKHAEQSTESRDADPQSAQDGSQEKPETTILETVVVTATRRAVPLLEVPDSVTAIGRQLLDQTQANGSGDVAAYAPGLNVQPTQGGANRQVISNTAGETASSAGISGAWHQPENRVRSLTARIKRCEVAPCPYDWQ